MFIMGRDTNCKQDVVDQNGAVSEREIAFSHSLHLVFSLMVWPKLTLSEIVGGQKTDVLFSKCISLFLILF